MDLLDEDSKPTQKGLDEELLVEKEISIKELYEQDSMIRISDIPLLISLGCISECISKIYRVQELILEHKSIECLTLTSYLSCIYSISIFKSIQIISTHSTKFHNKQQHLTMY